MCNKVFIANNTSDVNCHLVILVDFIDAQRYIMGIRQADCLQKEKQNEKANFIPGYNRILSPFKRM